MAISDIALSCDQGTVRVDIKRPLHGPRRTVLMASSGRVGPYTQVGPENELFELLASRLLPQGVSLVRFDADRPRRGHGPSTRDELMSRAARLRKVLAYLIQTQTGPITLVGISLGALAILQVLGDADGGERIDIAVLCSAVVEAPSVIIPALREIHLVYGEHDGITYLGTDGFSREILRPEVYGRRTAENLVVMPETTVHFGILPGVGHLMVRPKADTPDSQTVAHLAALTLGSSINGTFHARDQ